MYNGFRNRETWIVNLYLQNTEHWYSYYSSLSKVMNKEELAETIELDIRLLVPEEVPYLLSDLIEEVMRDIDWLVVAEHFYY